jgi:hypothetical protein
MCLDLDPQRDLGDLNKPVYPSILGVRSPQHTERNTCLVRKFLSNAV